MASYLNPVDRIVALFGGQAAMSRAIEEATGECIHQTTIMHWAYNGAVPFRRIPLVMRAAKARNISITYRDFFEFPDADEAPKPLRRRRLRQSAAG